MNHLSISSPNLVLRTDASVVKKRTPRNIIPGQNAHFGRLFFFSSATMSTTSPKATPFPNQKTHRRSQSASTSNSDWLGPSLLAARAMTAASDSAPFPYVRGIFATVVVVLESIEV